MRTVLTVRAVWDNTPVALQNLVHRVSPELVRRLDRTARLADRIRRARGGR